MSDPIDGENPEQSARPDAVDSVADFEVPAAEIPALEVPEPVIEDAVIADSLFEAPVIPPSPFAEPARRAARRRSRVWDDAAPASAAQGRGHVWDRASGASAASGADAVAPASDPRLTAPEPDPDLVPSEAAAEQNSYRGWTIAIYAFLLLLLVGAVVTIGVLLSGGSPDADAMPGAMLAAVAPPL